MSKTGRPKICVISRDQDMASFFSLEAQACSCAVTVLKAPPEEVGDYGLIFVDDRAGYCFSEHSDCQIITVRMKSFKRYDKKEGNGLMVWDWPISVKTLRETYEALWGRCAKSVEKPEPEISMSAETIFLFSDHSCRILYRNQVISLTESEWRILCALGKAEGDSISRIQLSSLISSNVGNAVDVHICHLRKKIEEPFGKKLIFTVRNQGYFIKAKIIEKAELV